LRTIGGDPTCSECIPEVLVLFEDALKTETSFPPRWGPEEISFEAFEDLFPNDFRLAYREKVMEYKTPIPKRVYCQHKVPTKDKSAGEPDADFCNSFLGSSECKGVSQCPNCTGWMCMECRGTAPPPPKMHACADTKDEPESEAFDQATKGKDWQEHPNSACKIKCDLRDASNAMSCLCGTEFCYVCGLEAAHDSDHWIQGKPCPRWGAAGATNQVFDRPVAAQGFEQNFGVVINSWEGNLVVLDPQRMNVRLFMDFEEAITLVEELSSEQHFVEDEEGNILKVILDTKELLHHLHDNLDWLLSDWVLTNMDPVLRPMFADAIGEAVGTTNFFIRDAIFQERLRETHAAALQVTGEDSVLFTVPVIEIFERYTTVHKPRMIENVQRFIEGRDAGRALRDQEQVDRFAGALFAGPMLQRLQQEDEADLGRRRGSI
jgi:hypothetical protein